MDSGLEIGYLDVFIVCTLSLRKERKKKKKKVLKEDESIEDNELSLGVRYLDAHKIISSPA